MVEVDPDGWAKLTREVAALAEVDERALHPATTVRELDLDSLALTELVVVLITELGMEHLSDDLESRDWSEVTLGSIYDEWQAQADPSC